MVLTTGGHPPTLLSWLERSSTWVFGGILVLETVLVFFTRLFRRGIEVATKTNAPGTRYASATNAKKVALYERAAPLVRLTAKVLEVLGNTTPVSETTTAEVDSPK
jgi:hypothetical protein